TIEDNSDNATRRQLVQMMLRDGLRKHGIPPGWVECRILVVNSRSRGQGLYLNLVMRHWDMLLLTYAHAFQQQLLSAITEFEPQASVWLHGISWELDVGDSCPYLDMPDPSIWVDILASDAPAPRASAAMPRPVVKATPPPEFTPMPAPVVAPVAPVAASVLPPAAPAPAPAVSEEDADVLADLERMFAIRDANIKQQAFADTAPVDFQNTEPSSRS
ncbi:MAG: hypothetical protein ACT6Q9_18765, partial [Polaromonas sp.]|uniref:hypothetical protein n=1 Tax=Polaromonas sp. TaxID=1869339 RepID=UPI00403646B7